MANYKPGIKELEAARKRNSFILMVNAGFKADIYSAWEKYVVKNDIQVTNTVGYGLDTKREACRALAYWIKYKSPAIDLILAYAKSHPEAGMQIFI